ncbi:AraC family transcriptional regulator [Akkermansiaceae bacterium]|nr:AraC family transcriptional regulator [Akkermansiaceae bacterium]
MSAKADQQESFLQSMKWSTWLTLLENLPGVCFFLKDSDGRYMAANLAYADYLGAPRAEDLIGKTDFDFHPKEVSQAYVTDDQKVMRTGESVIDLVEPWSTVDGRFGWTVTSKHAVHDEAGKVIGVAGVTRPSESDAVTKGSLDEGLDRGNSRAEFQASFLSQMKNHQGTRSLFENLPGVLFYIKNRKRQFIAANRMLVNRLGLASELEIVGTSDEDYFPTELSTGFEKDDREVLETGTPLMGKVEQYYNERRLLDWFISKKLPIYDRQGQIIGLMGVVRICNEAAAVGSTPLTGISKATELLRQNPDRRVTPEEMAAAAGVSVWQLRRRFREAFGMTPHDFERASRVQASCQALAESDASLAEIALDFGFCDQSAFSVQFRKLMGSSPNEYRKKQKRSDF